MMLMTWDCRSTIHEEANDFQTLTVLLRLSTKYQTTRLHLETVTLLLKSWPLTLDQWDHKELGTMTKQPDGIQGKNDNVAPFTSNGPVSLTAEQVSDVSGGMPMAILLIAVGCALFLAHD